MKSTMQCLLCQAQIDENKSFTAVVVGPNGPIDDLAGRVRHALDLEKWTQVTLTAQVAGGCRLLQVGHVCPGHDLATIAVGEISA